MPFAPPGRRLANGGMQSPRRSGTGKRNAAESKQRTPIDRAVYLTKSFPNLESINKVFAPFLPA
jgi:hypothetical protein